MYNFTKLQLGNTLYNLRGREDLSDFAEEYNFKLVFENCTWTCDFDCEVDKVETTGTVEFSDEKGFLFNIWIDDEEYFINSESQLEKFN